MVNLSNDRLNNFVQVVKVDSVAKIVECRNITTHLNLNDIVVTMYPLTWVTIWNFRQMVSC